MNVKDKIAKFMFDNGINSTGNKRNIPINDSNIIQPLKLDLVNTGIDFVKNQRFVRVRFLGSSKHYDYHFNTKEEYIIWNKELANLDFNQSIDIFNDESKIW